MIQKILSERDNIQANLATAAKAIVAEMTFSKSVT